mmetsp:Transcript_39823/g.68302  ORF Transcript_39823/g.68302 Transcript_39823/m.68302 type:complete len:194 (+) Transcript_39823:43-624(+)
MGLNQSNLKKEKLDDLGNKTHFSQEQLKELLAQFKRESPSGKISQEEFNEAMNLMGVVDPFLQGLVFKVFDKSKTGTITFSDFVNGLSVMTKGTSEEKLKFAFEMYDLDESGFITKEEMTTILESFYKLIGPSDDNPLATFSGNKYDAPQQLVDELFEQMDTTGDGKISLAEYQAGATKNPDIIQGLKLFSES